MTDRQTADSMDTAEEPKAISYLVKFCEARADVAAGRVKPMRRVMKRMRAKLGSVLCKRNRLITNH